MRIFASSGAPGHDPGQLTAPASGSDNYYVEVAQRFDAIAAGVAEAGFADPLDPPDAGLRPILAVHSANLVRTVRTAIERAIKGGRGIGGESRGGTHPRDVPHQGSLGVGKGRTRI
jgi:acetoin utilization deacetylase AcuC-like enzyme